ILDHGGLIAELGREANGRFDTGVRDQPDDDELMNTVLFQLQIKVGVGEAAGAPVLLGNHPALQPDLIIPTDRSFLPGVTAFSVLPSGWSQNMPCWFLPSA